MFGGKESGPFTPVRELTPQYDQKDPLAAPSVVIFMGKSPDFLGSTMRGGVGGAGEADKMKKARRKKPEQREYPRNLSFVETVDYLRSLPQDQYMDALVNMGNSLIRRRHKKVKFTYNINELALATDISPAAYNSRRSGLVKRYKTQNKREKRTPFDPKDKVKIRNRGFILDWFSSDTVALMELHALTRLVDRLKPKEFDFIAKIFPRDKEAIMRIKREKLSETTIGRLVEQLRTDRGQLLMTIKNNMPDVWASMTLTGETRPERYIFPTAKLETLKRLINRPCTGNTRRESLSPPRPYVPISRLMGGSLSLPRLEVSELNEEEQYEP